jgi:hypothetical protein
MTHCRKHLPRALPEPPADEPLPSFLEPGQLVADTQDPVPRAPLGRRAGAALWALRIFSIILSAMVIYAFLSRLRG